MDSSVTFAPGSERFPQSPFYSKLGSYFDRPEWWEEGAATLDAFFDENTPLVDRFDQRLEDLLDRLEPPRVVEEPQRSNNAGLTNNRSADNTTDLSLLEKEQDLDVRHDDNQTIEQSSDNHLQTTVVTSSNVLLPSAKAALTNGQEENRVAPAITNTFQDSSCLPAARVLIQPLSALDANTCNDSINTSSPVLTGTTTSTRQTSPQLVSSTRASSVIPDIESSLEHGSLAPPSLKGTKPGPSLGTTTAHHKKTSTILSPEIDNDIASIDPSAAVENDTALISATRNQGLMSDEHEDTTQEPMVTSGPDSTGLQAVKDELSDEYGLTTTIDSSILTQETEITVVHDPSSAAVSFFPPNPYSDIPSDFKVDATRISSEGFEEKLGHGGDEDDEDLSADSTLTSLATNDGQLPLNNLEQLSAPKEWRTVTPSPPPTSPLTPPPGWFATRHVDQDTMGGADSEEDVDAAPSATSTPDRPIVELGKVSPGISRNTKGLKIVTEAVDGLARKTETDDTEMPTTSAATPIGKRKQEKPHTDEPAQKRRLRRNAGVDEQSKATSESVPVLEDKTAKGKSDPAQRGKGKAKRDSPDELAPESPDELADLPASNPFGLNKAALSLAKPKLNRSTPSRSRARKPVNTSAPLRKLVGVARATRATVGNKELAGLLGASPPRKAEEKANADIGGRLRSQARTPTPASTPTPTPMSPLALVSTSAPTTQITDTVATESTDTSQTVTPLPARRKRPPGANPLGALELKELGSTPILETRTRVRTATVEPTPEPATIQSTVKPAPKRTKTNLSTTEVAAPASAELARTRSQNSAVEPTPEPAPKAAPAKRIRKPVAKPAAGPAVSSPFNLAAKSKGTPAASRKKAPTKQTAVQTDNDSNTPTGKSTEATTKRKRGNEGEESEKGPQGLARELLEQSPRANDSLAEMMEG
jgi:hypothetical protein